MYTSSFSNYFTFEIFCTFAKSVTNSSGLIAIFLNEMDKFVVFNILLVSTFT